MTASYQYPEGTVWYDATAVDLGDNVTSSGEVMLRTAGIDSRDYSGYVRSLETYTDVEFRIGLGPGTGSTTRSGLGVRVDANGLGYHVRPVLPHTMNGVWELIAYTDDNPETYVQLASMTPANVSAADATIIVACAVVGSMIRVKIWEAGDAEPAWGSNGNCMFARDSTFTAAGYCTSDAWGLVTDFTDQNYAELGAIIQWDRVIGRSVLTSGGLADTASNDTGPYDVTTSTIIRANRPCVIVVQHTKGSAVDATPTPSMTGLTVGAALQSHKWDTETTSLKRTTMFPAMAAADIAAGTTLTVTGFAANATGVIIEMIEFDGAYCLDSDGSDAFPNSQADANDTAATVTPAITLTFTNAYATSGVVCATGVDNNGGQTADGSLNEVADLSHASPASGLMLSWDDANDTTPTATTPNNRNCVIAAEVSRNNPNTHYGAFHVAGVASISSGATIAASGLPTVLGVASISSGVTVDATGTVETPGVAGVAAISSGLTVQAAGLRTVEAVAAISSGITLTVAGLREVLAAAAISSGTTLTAAAVREVLAAAAVASGFTLTATATRTVGGAAQVVSGFDVAAVGLRTVGGQTQIATGVLITAGGTKAVAAVVTFGFGFALVVVAGDVLIVPAAFIDAIYRERAVGRHYERTVCVHHERSSGAYREGR